MKNMKNMKSTILGSLVGFIAGGIVMAVVLMGYGNPQFEKAKVLEEEITLEQGQLEITLPKGTTIQFSHAVDGQPYYSLHFVGWPHRKESINEAQKWEYFFIKQ